MSDQSRQRYTAGASKFAPGKKKILQKDGGLANPACEVSIIFALASYKGVGMRHLSAEFVCLPRWLTDRW